VRRLTRDLPVEVGSFGTLNLDGVPPLAEAYTVAAGWGVDLSGHLSRVLSPGGVAPADLVLGFEQIHVRQAVVDGAAAQSRSFTLREFVRLLGDLGGPVGGSTVVERARLRVAAAHAARGGTPGRLDTDELGDPFGRRSNVYAAVGDELRRLSIALAVGLFDVDPAVAVAGIGQPDGR
jgi:protein-tyrosine-phosphatase